MWTTGGTTSPTNADVHFAGTFFTLFLELWLRSPFPVRGARGARSRPAEAARTVPRRQGAAIPLGAILVFLRCWVKLYGAVSMEVFGHLGFALDNTSAICRRPVRWLQDMGLQYVPGT